MGSVEPISAEPKVLLSERFFNNLDTYPVHPLTQDRSECTLRCKSSPTPHAGIMVLGRARRTEPCEGLVRSSDGDESTRSETQAIPEAGEKQLPVAKRRVQHWPLVEEAGVAR